MMVVAVLKTAALRQVHIIFQALFLAFRMNFHIYQSLFLSPINGNDVDRESAM